MVNVLVRLRLLPGEVRDGQHRADDREYEWIVGDETNRHVVDAEEVRGMIRKLRSQEPDIELPGCVLKGYVRRQRLSIAEYLETVIEEAVDG